MRFVGLFCLISMVLPTCSGQTIIKNNGRRSQSHGTCATSLISPFGAALVIDSRLTTEDAKTGEFISHKEGCKLLLARPTVLLAGIGLEDTTGNAGHWNSLDQASKFLATLADNPTEQQLNTWSDAWFRSLVKHYRSARETPPTTGKLAEMLLLTKVNGEPYFRRTTVEWDGTRFDGWVEGQDIDKTHTNIQYAGSCREFMVHNDNNKSLLPPRWPHTPLEEQRLDAIAQRKQAATTVAELEHIAFSYELVLNAEDRRLEGEERSGIAPPYATAEWYEGDAGWTVDLNPACKPSSPVAASK